MKTGRGTIEPEAGPAALLPALLDPERRDSDEARAACLWLADVGQALVEVAAGMRALASTRRAA